MLKQEILKDALIARKQESETYQINIDNYKLAINVLEEKKDQDLVEFEQQLKTLLESELLEQKKTKIMIEVIEMQLEASV
jgi:hypothetical protein